MSRVISNGAGKSENILVNFGATYEYANIPSAGYLGVFLINLVRERQRAFLPFGIYIFFFWCATLIITLSLCDVRSLDLLMENSALCVSRLINRVDDRVFLFFFCQFVITRLKNKIGEHV